MLPSWQATFSSRMRVLFKESVKNRSQQPHVFKIRYKFDAKLFSNEDLQSQQNSTLYVTRKWRKPEILFLQECCLLLLSAVVLMLLQPEPSTFHLHPLFIASLIQGRSKFKLIPAAFPKVQITDLKSKCVLLFKLNMSFNIKLMFWSFSPSSWLPIESYVMLKISYQSRIRLLYLPLRSQLGVRAEI